MGLVIALAPDAVFFAGEAQAASSLRTNVSGLNWPAR
jgi:hypothetical protein